MRVGRAGNASPQQPRRATAALSTIFIDLDDTLIDTFHLLIVPLEKAASAAICRSLAPPFTADELTSSLLELRKRSPAELRDELRVLLHAEAERGLAIRDRIFADFSVDALTIGHEALEVLQTLARDFALVLVTEGRRHIQERKIRHLGIGKLFAELLIVSGNDETKETAIGEYLRRKDIAAEAALVIGNRLDRDIIAGNHLAIPTIWLRSGEGSEMQPGGLAATPDAVIDRLAELPAAVSEITDRIARRGDPR
jgi:FMN phosphatase YigB (HAD superfamily)